MSLRFALLLGALLALTAAATVEAADYGFVVQRAELQRDESGKEFLLDADIDFHFSEQAIDALRNGVSIGLALGIKIKQESGWWEETVLEEKLSFRICYHALSKLYQIIYENNDPPRNFVSFNALLEAMGAIRGLPILPSARLQQGGRYRASLTVGLDIESLPLPLRPVAYITPAWHLSSAQYKWTFVN